MLVIPGVSVPMRAQQTANMNCDGEPVTDRQYQQQPGDVLEARRLEITRPFSGTGKLNVSVCNARLEVRTRPDPHELKLSIQMDGEIRRQTRCRLRSHFSRHSGRWRDPSEIFRRLPRRCDASGSHEPWPEQRVQ